MKRIIIVLAMVAGATLFALPAQAHTPQISASCDGITVSGTAYEGDKANKWGVTIEGVEHTGTFGESFSETIPVPQDGKTSSWSGYVQAEDGGYADAKNGSVGPCGTPPPVDVCADLPGDQPEGTDCTPEPVVTIKKQQREVVGEPNCETGLAVVSYQERQRTITDGVKGPWSEWVQYDNGTVPVEESDCLPSPEPITVTAPVMRQPTCGNPNPSVDFLTDGEHYTGEIFYPPYTSAPGLIEVYAFEHDGYTIEGNSYWEFQITEPGDCPTEEPPVKEAVAPVEAEVPAEEAVAVLPNTGGPMLPLGILGGLLVLGGAALVMRKRA